MNDPQLPAELLALIAEGSDDANGRHGGVPAARRRPAEELSRWLCGMVRSHDNGGLADLRRLDSLTEPRLRAAAFAPEEAQRHVFEKVAFLFARYHAGRSKAHFGYGSMGDALRRIGGPGGRGAKDPGATRLLDRLVASRDLPLRHLQHAVERARACEVTPPSWARLVDDLMAWESPDTSVAYDWARDFYTPASRSKKNG
ncbi:type I-E CRISPR-associated protein Cse2/CasB [Streptomyces celluloflavus]|uniref:type I-E CRISPR-associated protein Cse2/CasB n=1 Tax=Streptomyces celluloflavus TaxID=58344 RepID=UPI0034603A86|nr:type I-E CRISPR-associated protein Cse2/CasB [Streptomyces celluloflavus]